MRWQRIITNSTAKKTLGAGEPVKARAVTRAQPQDFDIDEFNSSPWTGLHYRHEFLLHHRHELLEWEQGLLGCDKVDFHRRERPSGRPGAYSTRRLRHAFPAAVMDLGGRPRKRLFVRYLWSLVKRTLDRLAPALPQMVAPATAR